MTTILTVLVGVVLISLISGRKTVSRMFSALGAQLNKLGRFVWGIDPVAVYQKQVDDATEEIRMGSRGLEQYKGLVSRIKRQIEADEKEVGVWDARARGYVEKGEDSKATDSLMNKKRVEVSLTEARAQLTQYEAAYQHSLKRIQIAQKRIEDARREAQRLQADLRMSQAEAEIARLSTSYNTNLGALDSLGEAREEIQRHIDANRAKAEVAHDLGQDGVMEAEAEESAAQTAAKSELAKLKAEMNGERERVKQP